MAFLLACAASDVPADEALGVKVGDYEIALAKQAGADGEEFYALQDLCSHGAVALSGGEVADCSLECWLHGSRFDLRTGKPITFPATEPVATFPVEVRDDGVYIDTATTLNGVSPT